LDYPEWPQNHDVSGRVRTTLPHRAAPNNRIPAIVDFNPADQEGPLSLFESGAILLYLADKIGRFIPTDLRGRNQALEWLFWQMAGLGPMAGQNHHFSVYAPERLPYAIERYVKETSRLYAVLDRHLSEGRDFIAGEYSIADMACYPWIVPYERQGQRLEDYPALERWFKRIQSRPATERAYRLAESINPANNVMDEASKAVLFGQDASTIRAR